MIVESCNDSCKRRFRRSKVLQYGNKKVKNKEGTLRRSNTFIKPILGADKTKKFII